MSFAKSVDGGIELRLKVIPNAKRDEIVGVHGGMLKVKVAAPPEDGRANEAVIRLLQHLLGTKDVELVRGGSSRQKTVRVGGITELPANLLGALGGGAP